MSGNLPSPLKALTGCKLRTSLPQIPSSIGKSVETSKNSPRIALGDSQVLQTIITMELKPGQPVFMKEVQLEMYGTLV